MGNGDFSLNPETVKLLAGQPSGYVQLVGCKVWLQPGLGCRLTGFPKVSFFWGATPSLGRNLESCEQDFNPLINPPRCKGQGPLGPPRLSKNLPPSSGERGQRRAPGRGGGGLPFDRGADPGVAAIRSLTARISAATL